MKQLLPLSGTCNPRRKNRSGLEMPSHFEQDDVPYPASLQVDVFCSLFPDETPEDIQYSIIYALEGK
ncbi:MAG: hypothetical protein F4X92_09315 [Gammaproteobacteria bacterium]|nr:hypothetical protein [Gammaproteobacteria bacterium]